MTRYGDASSAKSLQRWHMLTSSNQKLCLISNNADIAVSTNYVLKTQQQGVRVNTVTTASFIVN